MGFLYIVNRGMLGIDLIWVAYLDETKNSIVQLTRLRYDEDIFGTVGSVDYADRDLGTGTIRDKYQLDRALRRQLYSKHPVPWRVLVKTWVFPLAGWNSHGSALHI